MDPDTNIILGTGDILCSTYARSIGQPCALDGTGGRAEALILFSQPFVKIDGCQSHANGTLNTTRRQKIRV